MSGHRQRFRSIFDILCAARRSTDRCLEMLDYLDSRASGGVRQRVAVSFRGDGPVFPVEPVIVDAIQIALQLLPERTLLLLGYDHFTLTFSRGTLSNVFAHTEESAMIGLRVARSWTAGARLGMPLDQARPNGMWRWSVTHGRRRWRHAGPPNLIRALLRRNAITGATDVHLLGAQAPWTYVVVSPHPTVALEVLEGSPLRPFLAGRVVVAQVAGEIRDTGKPG